MNMVVFPKLQETLSQEKMSLSQKTTESSRVSLSSEKKTDFEKTLQKVIHDDTRQKKSSVDSLLPEEKLKKIQEDVATLIEHPEMQTDENIARLLEELMAFLTQGTVNIPQEKKAGATSVLSALKELVSQWEKGMLSKQDFLKELFSWLQGLETANQVFLSLPSQGESSQVSSFDVSLSRREESKPLVDNAQDNLSSPFRVVDKRTQRSETLSPTTTFSRKETVQKEFSSRIETLIKQIEGKNQIDGKEMVSPQIQKSFQDNGIKLAPALPSLPRVSVEQMLQQVAGKALITLRDGQSEMRLQLTPPDLGRMEMKIVLEDGQMRGKIVVSTPEAKALFDQNLGELQRQLQQVGVQVGSLDVSLGQSGRGEEESPSFVSKAGPSHEGSEVIGMVSEERSSLWKDNRINYVV
ncbi:flagellar hook-length control protein FliK [Thermospira aquatica]|uniref:Flagellar hook-length control protein FliK n=1 Tax=Thermospira aquatica TaxID=2828656 RepID=A0AAX3BEZ5_9SPIR|nr:flagellar hook-length control protein FliK [Thermospira aquatica]URA10904.1 flagellar hook-length control protein FliK [Thermospira aquatica]